MRKTSCRVTSLLKRTMIGRFLALPCLSSFESRWWLRSSWVTVICVVPIFSWIALITSSFVHSPVDSEMPWKQRLGRRDYCSCLSASVSKMCTFFFSTWIVYVLVRNMWLMDVVIVLMRIGAICSMPSRTEIIMCSLEDLPRLPFDALTCEPRELFNCSRSSTKHCWLTSYRSGQWVNTTFANNLNHNTLFVASNGAITDARPDAVVRRHETI